MLINNGGLFLTEKEASYIRRVTVTNGHHHHHPSTKLSSSSSATTKKSSFILSHSNKIKRKQHCHPNASSSRVLVASNHYSLILDKNKQKQNRVIDSKRGICYKLSEPVSSQTIQTKKTSPKNEKQEKMNKLFEKFTMNKKLNSDNTATTAKTCSYSLLKRQTAHTDLTFNNLNESKCFLINTSVSLSSSMCSTCNVECGGATCLSSAGSASSFSCNCERKTSPESSFLANQTHLLSSTPILFNEEANKRNNGTKVKKARLSLKSRHSDLKTKINKLDKPVRFLRDCCFMTKTNPSSTNLNIKSIKSSSSQPNKLKKNFNKLIAIRSNDTVNRIDANDKKFNLVSKRSPKQSIRSTRRTSNKLPRTSSLSSNDLYLKKHKKQKTKHIKLTNDNHMVYHQTSFINTNKNDNFNNLGDFLVWYV
jgi:hypothetical protein